MRSSMPSLTCRGRAIVTSSRPRPPATGFRTKKVAVNGSAWSAERRGTAMRKRLVIPSALVVAAIVAAVLAAGSAGRVGANGPAGKSAPSGTITLNGWQSSPVEDDLLRKVVKDFEKSHPKIKVNF